MWGLNWGSYLVSFIFYFSPFRPAVDVAMDINAVKISGRTKKYFHNVGPYMYIRKICLDGQSEFS